MIDVHAHGPLVQVQGHIVIGSSVCFCLIVCNSILLKYKVPLYKQLLRGDIQTS